MLDKVNGEARAGYGGTSAGWSKSRPEDRAVTEALAASPGHIIVTLKARTDTVIEIDLAAASTPAGSASGPSNEPTSSTTSTQ